jgi:hypothetical protein
MSPIVAFDTLIVVAMWTWALWGHLMRTLRTVLLLACTTALYLVATQLPLALGVPMRSVVMAGTVWLLLFHVTWFLALSKEKWEFDQRYRAALDSVRRLAQSVTAGDVPAVVLPDRLDEIATVLTEARPPDRAWGKLQDRTIAYLRVVADRSMRLLDGDLPTEEPLPAPDDLTRDYENLRASRASFWR